MNVAASVTRTAIVTVAVKSQVAVIATDDVRGSAGRKGKLTTRKLNVQPKP